MKDRVHIRINAPSEYSNNKGVFYSTDLRLIQLARSSLVHTRGRAHTCVQIRARARSRKTPSLYHDYLANFYYYYPYMRPTARSSFVRKSAASRSEFRGERNSPRHYEFMPFDVLLRLLLLLSLLLLFPILLLFI